MYERWPTVGAWALIPVVIGWSTSVIAPSKAGPAALLTISHLGNIALHAGWAAKHRRYDPGLVTALVTLAPTAVGGLKRLRHEPDRRAVAIGAALGAAASFGLPLAMKRRLAAGPSPDPR